MNLRLLIPVKPLAEGKQRLAERLSPTQRHRLNRHFCLHTFQVACQVLTPAQCIVVSRCEEVMALACAHGMQPLHEHLPGGLNAALEQASVQASLQGADVVVSLSCDLPGLGSDDLSAMLARATPGRVVVGTDRSGTGTNALLCPPGRMAYAYGPDSHARHRHAAVSAGLAFECLQRPGLADDVDTPADFDAHRMSSILISALDQMNRTQTMGPPHPYPPPHTTSHPTLHTQHWRPYPALGSMVD